MRARYLKPDVFLDEELAELPIPARYLLLGLQCAADREGRLEDRPKRIKGTVYTYDDVDVEELLARLAAARFITRYAVDGRKYIQLTHFHRDQRPHSNESESKIPPGPEVATSNQGEQDLSPKEEALRSEKGELDTENGERSREGESRADARPHPNGYAPKELAEDWNATAEKTGLRLCREVSPARSRIATQRIREHPGRDYWRSVIRRVGASSFCRGSNGRGWRADFDFLLRPGTATSALEGKYDDGCTAHDAKMAKNLGAAQRFSGQESEVRT